MDEKALGPVEGPLMRARLHMRCGRRRITEGKVSLGIITLYDAINSAMQWYVAVPERKNSLKISESDDLNDEKTLYRVLTDSGVLDRSFDYGAYDELVGKALEQEMSSYDYHDMLSGIETVMTRLGVMPFDESKLPPEDPETE
jgi:hypothetical protein